MHYYQFHIGDYRAATAHLTNDEDLAYRRLIDMYYDIESPIPLDTHWVARRIRVDEQVVIAVLKDMFELTETGYKHARCEAQIVSYHALVQRNKANGSLGGRPKASSLKAKETQSVTTGKLTKNQEPITIVEAKQSRGTRLPKDWMPSEDQISFCRKNRADLLPEQVADSFRDYWVAQAGSKGVKLDWDATWRNWVRNQKVFNFETKGVGGGGTSTSWIKAKT
jgi:uncharacterized protein YdaU (DUF1376 family)